MLNGNIVLNNTSNTSVCVLTGCINQIAAKQLISYNRRQLHPFTIELLIVMTQCEVSFHYNELMIYT